MLRVLLRILLLVLVLGLAGALAAGWGWQRFTGPGPLPEERTVVIERGAGVAAIARQLAEAGVLPDPWTFRIGQRLFGEGQPLKAGEYLFAAHIPARDVLLIAATPLAVRRGYRFEVNLLGKAATWLLYASLAFVMVTSPDADWPLWIFWTGFALAVASLVPYTFKAWREAR